MGSPDEPMGDGVCEPDGGDGAGTDTEACDSCGWPEADLITVRRIYLQVEQERVVGGQPADDLERWCAACRAIYAHEQPV
jgi:hypothetical protein